MNTRRDDAGGVIVLRVTGTLAVGGNSRLFREHLDDLLRAGLKNIVVDLAKVTDINSAGVGELLMAREAIDRVGGEIKLLNLGKHPRDISHAMILAAAFRTFEDERSAILSDSSSTEIGSEFCWVDGWPRLVGPRGGSTP